MHDGPAVGGSADARSRATDSGADLLSTGPTISGDRERRPRLYGAGDCRPGPLRALANLQVFLCAFAPLTSATGRKLRRPATAEIRSDLRTPFAASTANELRSISE